MEDRVNPRYVAYAAAHCETDPAAMLARDRICSPGNAGIYFMLWIGRAWAAWCREHDRDRYEFKSRADHAVFDLWLLTFKETR